MVSFLIRYFIPKDVSTDSVRGKYGLICGAVGIFLNLLLFIGKFTIGTISNSISITADAFNNLSDAGSSAVTLGGFIWSERGADSEHPFGHGRIEYISGILISVVIILVGVELLKSSVSKIINPGEFIFNKYVFIVLILSICVKLYMALYNKKYGKRINSETLRAAASDSISDCAATGAVLISSVIMFFTHVQIDGYAGLLVSLLILWTGIKSVIDTTSPLLGQVPDSDFVKRVEEIVFETPETIKIHDLVVHDYGPSKKFVSLHMEVDGTKNIFELHDAVDLTERRISEELNCEAVIHMDPIDVNNPILNDVYNEITTAAKKIDIGISIHDLRMVPGPTHTNIIFDICVTPELISQKKEIESNLEIAVKNINENYFAVMKTEISYC